MREINNGKAEEPAIVVRDVSFRYGDREILTDVQMSVSPFDSICIVGPNGGGKTTLVKLIVGLLKPLKGSVRIFGVTAENAKKRIGYVPQYAVYDSQFPISVKEVVCMGRLRGAFFNRFTKKDWEHTMQALGEVDLLHSADRPFSSLSGGQRQRALIARAMASGGDILLLDEPTANIDQESEKHLFELLEELNRRMTILMVTHDVGFVSTFFKRIACVNGRVVTHLTSELTGEVIREMYGGDFQMIHHDHSCSPERRHNE